MPRRQPQFIQRKNGQANREKRSHEYIKVVRMMHSADSSRISDVLRKLRQDDASLGLAATIPQTHALFIIDPRILQAELNRGTKSSFNWHKAEDRLRANESMGRVLPAYLGKVSLRGVNRRTITCDIEAPQSRLEKCEAYSVLAELGMKGLHGRRIECPGISRIKIGELVEWKDKSQREEQEVRILEALTIGLLAEGVQDASFGPAHTFTAHPVAA